MQPTQTKKHRAKQVISILAAAVALGVTGLYASLHSALIPHPGPHEYREGAMLVTTQFLLEGKNPYAAEHLPLSTNAYGLLYNYAVYPLAARFGNTFAVHRLVTAIFLLGSCTVLYLFLARISRNRLWALLGATLLYCLFVFSYGVCARPDYMGVFFYLLGIFLSWRWDFSRKSLALGFPFIFLAFMAKPYFLLGFGVIAAFLFLQRSKQFALLYFAASMALTAALVALITIPFPFYLYCTFAINQAVSSMSLSHLFAQFGAFATLHAGLLLTLLLLLLFQLRNPEIRATIRQHFRHPLSVWTFSQPRHPLLKKTIGFQTIHLLVVLLAVAYLGQHAGAFLIYLICLLSPALLLFFAEVSRNLPRDHPIPAVGFAVTFLVMALYTPPEPTPVFVIHNDLHILFSDGKPVFYNSLLVHQAIASGQEFYSSGQTHYFRYPLTRSRSDHFQELKIYTDYLKRTRARIDAQEFSYILTDTVSHDELEVFDNILRSYDLHYVFEYPLFYALWMDPQDYGLGNQDVLIWVPKKLEQEEQ